MISLFSIGLIVLLIIVLFPSTIRTQQQERNYCPTPNLDVWNRVTASRQPKVISVVAGQHAPLLECEAMGALDWDKECDNVNVEWKWIHRDVTATIDTKVGIRRIFQWNSASGSTGECNGTRRYCGDGHRLNISYAQAGIDDKRYFYCKVTRSTNIDGGAAYSFFQLQIEKCPIVMTRAERDNLPVKPGPYRGNPCHYGKCVMRNITVKNSSSMSRLVCHCFPGYEGDFCENKIGITKKKQETFSKVYFYMFLSWTPAIVGVVLLIVGIFLYANRRTELVFEEAEMLSPHVRVPPTTLSSGGKK